MGKRDFDNNFLFAQRHNGSYFYYNSTIFLLNKTGDLIWETHLEPTKPNEGVVVFDIYEYDDLTGEFMVDVMYYTTSGPGTFSGFSSEVYVYYFDSSGNYVKNVSKDNFILEYFNFNSSHLGGYGLDTPIVVDYDYTEFSKRLNITDTQDYNFFQWVELPDKGYMFFGEKLINTTDPRYDSKYVILKTNHDFRWNKEQITGVWP
jgi:hypothetical protein